MSRRESVEAVLVYTLYITAVEICHRNLQSPQQIQYQSWKTPTVLQRHRAHQRTIHPSHLNRCGAWKKPVYEPKPFAPNTDNSQLRRARKLPIQLLSLGKSDQQRRQSRLQTAMPAALGSQAATMASHSPKTQVFGRRASFRSMSSMTLAK